MNKEEAVSLVSWQRRVAGWLLHMFTASGAYVGLLALLAIYHGKYTAAFWCMGVTVLIDAVDGMIARLIRIKIAVPQIDGALLDNIVDFFTYTIIPSFFLLIVPLTPIGWDYVAVAAIVFSSAYQFTQVDAKTLDHFFKGFPSYWNIVVFYLFFWQMNPWINLGIIFLLAVLSFVPIKYVYPSRLEYLTKSAVLRVAMVVATLIWGVATMGLLWVYPKSNLVFVVLSLSYMILYAAVSLYRTWVPLKL